MENMTFIVFFKDGHRETVSTSYREGIEREEDAAWDYIHSMYPEAEYIEHF
jgi:hypothetical protein